MIRLKTKRPYLNSLLLGAYLLVASFAVSTHLAADPALAPEAAPDAEWQWHLVKVKTEINGEEVVKGHLLFTTDPESVGAAFRCDKGKLIALLSSEPVNFRQLLDLRFHGSEDWQVRYTLNGGDEKTEDWVQMYRGRIFMVRNVETTKEIFRLANSQGTVEFTRKYGKPVSVTMPAPRREVFDEFLQVCALKSDYQPELLASPPNDADTTVQTVNLKTTVPGSS